MDGEAQIAFILTHEPYLVRKATLECDNDRKTVIMVIMAYNPLVDSIVSLGS